MATATATERERRLDGLGVALIGCGGMGRSEARVLKEIPRARLMAVCDVSEAAAREFGAEMGWRSMWTTARRWRFPRWGR